MEWEAKITGRRQRDKMVKVKVRGKVLNPFADTGCRHTIITPVQYRERMGRVKVVDTRLRVIDAKKRGKSSGYLLTHTVILY